MLENDAGPTAWAVRTDNLGLEALRIRGTGVSVTAPVRAGRSRLDRMILEWQTASVGVGPNGSFFPFLIQDFTPRALRAMPSGKPTNPDFEGVAKVVIAVVDLKQSITRFRRAYALAEPKTEKNKVFGGMLADFEGTPLMLAEAGSRALQFRVGVLGEGPCAFILKGTAIKDYKFRSKSTMFGRETQWFDEKKLGWRLGVQ